MSSRVSPELESRQLRRRRRLRLRSTTVECPARPPSSLHRRVALRTHGNVVARRSQHYRLPQLLARTSRSASWPAHSSCVLRVTQARFVVFFASLAAVHRPFASPRPPLAAKGSIGLPASLAPPLSHRVASPRFRAGASSLLHLRDLCPQAPIGAHVSARISWNGGEAFCASSAFYERGGSGGVKRSPAWGSRARDRPQTTRTDRNENAC